MKQKTTLSPLRKVFLDKINRIYKIFSKRKTLIINNIILMDFYAFLKIGFSERIRALISNGIYAVEYDKKNKWALAPNKIIICPL
ncbi:MAG: hypothetical protein DRJ01_05115 [Bacteroidetes bacterium]|nr:MAG: hypothetical protein DRJ01_05115 [Bacteroidota bacterium]